MLSVLVVGESVGENVDCCGITHEPEPGGVRVSSYQRTPARPAPSTLTVWLNTSVSWSPKLRYWSGPMGQMERPSNVFVWFGCGTQFWFKELPPQRSDRNVAGVSVCTRLKVVLAGTP